MTKIESVVKNALLNGKDFQTKRGWIIKISTDDKVQIWPPKGEGRETTLAFLDKAVKDFCKQADVMAPGINETNAPKSTSNGSLGKDTSGKSPKKFDPSVNKTPKPEGSFTDKSLGADTSMDEGFATPSINKDMTPDNEGLTDTDLGSDSSGNSTKFDNKVVNVQSDGRTGKIQDTFANGPDPSEIYRKLNAKSVSKELLNGILNAEEWVATQRLAQMDKNQPKRGPGMPGKGKGNFSEGPGVGGQIGAEDDEDITENEQYNKYFRPYEKPNREEEEDKAVGGKKSLRTAGPKLREKWLNDGGYHREIESESAEELHALVQGFGGEDVDWAKFKPAMPEEKDAEVEQQPVQEGAGAAPITAKTSTSNNETFAKYDAVKEILGADELLDNLIKAMDDQEANENIDFIIQMYDLSSAISGTEDEDFEMEASRKAQSEESSLYQDLVDAGIEVDNHETDLYFPVTDESTEILNNYPMQMKNTTTFKDHTTGERMYDTPFAHTPTWEKKLRGSKNAQSADVEAVDEDAKDMINNYFGEYGKELTKDTGVSPKKDNPKDKLKKRVEPKLGQAAPPPATPAAPAPAAPGGPGAAPAPGGQPAAPAPKAPAPKAPQGLQPGVGDAGIQALGWTAEDVQSMTDEQKKGILQIKLTKPGTEQKPQMQPKTPAPKTPAPGGPGTPPAGPQGPAAPGSEPAPPAPSAPSPKAVKGGKKVKRGQAAPLPETEEAPAAPAQEAPQSPAAPGKAPATPAAPKGPTKPAGGPAQDPGQAGGGQEQQAFQILQEVQASQVNAATPNEVSTAKVSALLQRLLTELGVTPDQASKLFGLQRGNFGTLFK